MDLFSEVPHQNVDLNGGYIFITMLEILISDMCKLKRESCHDFTLGDSSNFLLNNLFMYVIFRILKTKGITVRKKKGERTVKEEMVYRLYPFFLVSLLVA